MGDTFITAIQLTKNVDVVRTFKMGDTFIGTLI